MTARIPCPKCSRMKPAFAIRDGRCRDDLLDEARQDAEPYTLQWVDIRAERNKRLTACDWTQVPDAPLSTLQKAGWAAYRQTLRDLPETHETPQDVTWPTPPG